MTNNFEEFLKKQCPISKYPKEYGHGNGNISVKDLGEFEIAEIKRLKKENENAEIMCGLDLAYNEEVIQYLTKRAEALLGKTETDKRLSEGGR